MAMPVMPKWVDYLPDEAHARAVITEAREKARGGTLSFANAAAEAVRLGVLVDPKDAATVLQPHRERLRTAFASMSSRNGPDAIFGVLALTTADLIHTGRLEGYDRERETRVLGELAVQNSKSQPLAYAALAAARPDLAKSFWEDAALVQLANGDATAYIHFVGTFLESDYGYDVLGLVARAYSALVEKRTGVGVRSASTWLHRTVHEGPQPVHAASVSAAEAEEAIRTLVDLGTNESMQVFYACSERLQWELLALSARSGPEKVFAVLALINVALIHGGYVDGWYDRITRGGLDREAEMLGELAAQGVKSRPLAFAALGSGRTDIAQLLSNDPAIAALGSGDAKAYSDFVAGLRGSSYTYAELGFVGRAYAMLVEKRGPGGIGIGAKWLYDTSRFGPQPVSVFVEPKPLPKIRATWLAASDVQGLWGGKMVDITPNGDVTLVAVQRGCVDWTVTKGTLTPDELAELRCVVAEHDPRTMNVPMENGAPDEVFVSLTYVVDGREHHVHKWNHQRHGGFDAVVSSLFGTGHRVESRARP
jgi:hypothetical protein